jgi:hypothetical protein
VVKKNDSVKIEFQDAVVNLNFGLPLALAVVRTDQW